MSKFKAVGIRILVDPKPVDKVTKAGIILPGMNKDEEKPTNGVVLSVGADVKTVKNGDKVHFNKYTAVELKEGDSKFYVLKEEDIYVVEI